VNTLHADAAVWCPSGSSGPRAYRIPKFDLVSFLGLDSVTLKEGRILRGWYGSNSTNNYYSGVSGRFRVVGALDRLSTSLTYWSVQNFKFPVCGNTLSVLNRRVSSKMLQSSYSHDETS